MSGAREHSRGHDTCGVCGHLARCLACGKKSLHRVDGEYVCENRCSPHNALEKSFKEEMKAALEKVR